MSVSLTSERDSVGILKATGTHFIVYIPSSSSCCSPSDKDASDGSLTAEGGYTMMLNNDLILLCYYSWADNNFGWLKYWASKLR